MSHINREVHFPFGLVFALRQSGLFADSNLGLKKKMAAQPKILLLDDDEDFLDLYQEMLSRHLPSVPEVKTATSGSRALSILEAEGFNLLSVDLNMPKMDGLQVLSIARRKYPQLRLVVLTGIRDEQFRTRAYAMGVDQYWIKPESDQEMGLLMESFESLINQEVEGGFRGIQSKSLVDIIQLECLSQSSALLRITNRAQEGKIWIQKGEVVDAEVNELSAEPAFQRILSWKTGSFEILPADLNRPRTIFTSYQGLLLNTAQALDEAMAAPVQPDANPSAPSPPVSGRSTLIAELAQMPGVEFILATDTGEDKPSDFWGLENPEPLSNWAAESLKDLDALGDRLQLGQLQFALGTTIQRKIAIATSATTNLCVGLTTTLPADHAKDVMKSILSKWAS
jgi:CheY-like chemotaxis protein